MSTDFVTSHKEAKINKITISCVFLMILVQIDDC